MINSTGHTQVVGTPTEETWPGVTQLPNYKPHRLVLHRPRRLASLFSRLNDIPHAESLATQFLQVDSIKYTLYANDVGKLIIIGCILWLKEMIA